MHPHLLPAMVMLLDRDGPSAALAPRVFALASGEIFARQVAAGQVWGDQLACGQALPR